MSQIFIRNVITGGLKYIEKYEEINTDGHYEALKSKIIKFQDHMKKLNLWEIGTGLTFMDILPNNIDFMRFYIYYRDIQVLIYAMIFAQPIPDVDDLIVDIIKNNTGFFASDIPYHALTIPEAIDIYEKHHEIYQRNIYSVGAVHALYSRLLSEDPDIISETSKQRNVYTSQTNGGHFDISRFITKGSGLPMLMGVNTKLIETLQILNVRSTPAVYIQTFAIPEKKHATLMRYNQLRSAVIQSKLTKGVIIPKHKSKSRPNELINGYDYDAIIEADDRIVELQKQTLAIIKRALIGSVKTIRTDYIYVREHIIKNFSMITRTSRSLLNVLEPIVRATYTDDIPLDRLPGKLKRDITLKLRASVGFTYF
jgi:hypothetical protein|uniref:Uncharacterized protein n=1 Tax=viral metagenome TaxID=1070528 RepID=A0A6C0IU40_9ZZZZ